ncbi:MAG: hypothetical protein Q9218_000439 [Villophora microphyllina]
MAVSLLQASVLTQPQIITHSSPAMMDAIDMDIDMDIDVGPIDGPEAVKAIVCSSLAFRPTSHVCKAHILRQDLPEQLDHSRPAVVQSNSQPEVNTTPRKVHLRGLDDLTTTEIELFTSEHHPTDHLRRVEWIDDLSANLVYGTPAAAIRALDSFTSFHVGQEPCLYPPLQLRSAKSSSVRPDSKLEVRLAMATDVKRPRAHEASRFYMMHPEHDPREKKRQLQNHGGSRNHQERRYSERENRWRRFHDTERRYNAKMYDDETTAMANRGFASRRSSASVGSDLLSLAERPGDRRGCPRSGHRGDYYRPPARDERRNVRRRSASPGMDGRTYQESNGRGTRQRSPTTTNHEKELFPSRSTPLTSSVADKDLFPNKTVAASLRKELFPSKAGTPRHRRSDAFDAADEAADRFATGMAFSDARAPSSEMAAAVGSSHGRLLSSDATPQYDALEDRTDEGMSIRGASKQQDSGIAIFGAASKPHVGTIQELFPNRIGNSGKELFAEKLHGRGLKRNKAEDMFY